MKQVDLLLPDEFQEPMKHALNMCKDSSKPFEWIMKMILMYKQSIIMEKQLEMINGHDLI